MRNTCRLLLAMYGATLSQAQAAPLPFFKQYPHIDMKRWYISDGWSNGDYMACEWRADAITVQNHALLFTLSDQGGNIRPYGCGEMHTRSASGYGSYEARLRAASGFGLNTAFFTFTGPAIGGTAHDEIDFEFLGKDSRTVQLNYFVNGKAYGGNTIKLDFDASKEFHDYRFDWRADKITWYIDGKPVYETPKGAVIPSHPGYIYMSLWAGSEIEDSWLGAFSYRAPVTAEFASVKYTP